jgi:hypothetical protein
MRFIRIPDTASAQLLDGLKTQRPFEAAALEVANMQDPTRYAFTDVFVLEYVFGREREHVVLDFATLAVNGKPLRKKHLAVSRRCGRPSRKCCVRSNGGKRWRKDRPKKLNTPSIKPSCSLTQTIPTMWA